MARRRVAVTGLGVVSAIGSDPQVFFDSLVAGRSGVRRSAFDPSIAAAAVDFTAEAHFSRLALASLDRVSQLALVAVDQAVRDAALRERDLAGPRVGVYFGTGFGGAGSIESAYRAYLAPGGDGRLPPMTVVLTMANAAAAHISLRHGIRGPSLTYSVACASSAIAIGEAFRAIRDGYVDVAIAAGSEALLTPGTLAAWKALRVMAAPDREHPERSCRPFSGNRGGLVLGEGAAALVLEAEEHAQARERPVSELIAGYAVTSDASHLTKPSADGQAEAMLAALDDAGMAPDAVDYVNAHGTATSVGDVSETAAIRQALGGRASRVPVSATKALHGHLLGAAGALEMVATLLAMRHGVVPATCHYDAPDPECDLDYVPNTARRGVPIRVAMSNSFAFGGTNAVLVAQRTSAD